MPKTDDRAKYDTIFDDHDSAVAKAQEEADAIGIPRQAVMKSHFSGYGSGQDDVAGHTPKDQIRRMSEHFPGK